MLAMMVDLEDDDEWAMADELEDDDFDRSAPTPRPSPTIDSLALCAFMLHVCSSLLSSNAVAGESALDRIACGLGGKIILPMIKQHIMQMLHNRESRSCFLTCVAASSFNDFCVCRQPTGSTVMPG